MTGQLPQRPEDTANVFVAATNVFAVSGAEAANGFAGAPDDRSVACILAMNFKERFDKAMTRGAFVDDDGRPNNHRLAEALTVHLRNRGLLHADKNIPPQTIFAIRKRGELSLLSGYLLHIAYLCGVTAAWLAFGEGPEEAGAASETYVKLTDAELAHNWDQYPVDLRRSIVTLIRVAAREGLTETTTAQHDGAGEAGKEERERSRSTHETDEAMHAGSALRRNRREKRRKRTIQKRSST
jgi:hypothetical protein